MSKHIRLNTQSWREFLLDNRSILSHYKMESKPEIILPAAEDVINHNFILLGQKYFNVPNSSPEKFIPINWDIDPSTKYVYPRKTWFKFIRRTLPPGIDIKYVWELSRCQHFTLLGEAYKITNDEKYAIEFRNQILDWIANNPNRYSPNWSCTMEVSIRVSNWIISLFYFCGSHSLDDESLSTIMDSIRAHGDHIRNNLENLQPSNSNHYVADIAGLFLLSITCPWIKRSNSWLEFSQSSLETEIVKQTLNDGWNHESSTSYHRLVTEFFLYVYLAGNFLNKKFSSQYERVLKKMILVLKDIMKSDYTIPQIGDNDSGRFIIFNHDLDAGSLNVEYLILIALKCGLIENIDTSKYINRYYSSAGRYLYKTNNIYFLLSAGPKGQDGNGGHAHNDVSSYELNIKGRDIIVDPGTYCYTSDKKMRNSFRSVQNHNTLYWPEIEPCTLSKGLFSLPEEGHLRVFKNAIPDKIFSAKYSYSGRHHHRRVYIKEAENEIIIEDSCSHLGSMLSLNFDTGITPLIKDHMIQIDEILISFEGIKSLEMMDTHVSPSYGTLHPAKKIVASLGGLKCIQRFSFLGIHT